MEEWRACRLLSVEQHTRLVPIMPMLMAYTAMTYVVMPYTVMPYTVYTVMAYVR